MDRHYFVDYEVFSCGQAVAFGQFALTWDQSPDQRFDPAGLLAQVRATAASRHGVDPGEIRVTVLMRL